MIFPAAQPVYAPASASTDRAAHLAGGIALPALSTRSPAWQPGPGPSAGKQASGAGGPFFHPEVRHGR
jgi:hypothetical protein